ncbi:MAG: NTP transferase domain-containing protein [Candidatus Woesearchaeota archaeon]
MVSAVILAGGQAKDQAKTRLVRSIHSRLYGENYLWGKYKPLKQITVNDNGEKRTGSMLELTLKNVAETSSIDDIVIVGEQERITAMIQQQLTDYKAKVIQQIGSISQNAVEGYKNTNAAKNNESALFIPCDIPKVSSASYESFIKKCLEYDFDIMYAIIGKENITKKTSLASRLYHSVLNTINRIAGGNVFHSKDRMYFRPYFWVIDDVFTPEYQETKNQSIGNIIVDAIVNIYGILTKNPDIVDASRTQRRGFRLANISYGNPTNVDNHDLLDKAYSVRKLLNPLNIKEIADDFLPSVVAYFRGRLSISQLNKIGSNAFQSKFSLIEVEDIAMTLDIDSEEDAKDIIYLK